MRKEISSFHYTYPVLEATELDWTPAHTTGLLAILQYKTVETFSLVGNTISYINLSSILELIQRHPYLRHFRYEQMALDYNKIGLIAFLLEKNILETLSLRNTHLTDYLFDRLLAGLKNNTGLRHLYLDYNNLNAYCLEKMTQIIRAHPSLETITLERNGMEALILRAKKTDEAALLHPSSRSAHRSETTLHPGLFHSDLEKNEPSLNKMRIPFLLNTSS